MIPEKVFQQILALGEAWRVNRMDYIEKESKVLIRVEEMPALWASEICPHCEAESVGGYDHAPERRWRHLWCHRERASLFGTCPALRSTVQRADWSSRSGWFVRKPGPPRQRATPPPLSRRGHSPVHRGSVGSAVGVVCRGVARCGSPAAPATGSPARWWS